MGIIKLLDEKTCALIAAGEVIVNPAAVVKELVENSIDAGSSTIDIEIFSGGKTMIRVSDNGEGMDADDLEMAFLRNATSKLTSISDDIETLGFRGEALSSIASVSKIKAITRKEPAAVGNVVSLEPGKISSMKTIPFQKGTLIEIRNLFFNMPARLKNMKKDVQESQDIVDITTQLTLSHPEISFRLSADNKKIFQSDGKGIFSTAIATVFGKKFIDASIDLEFNEDPMQLYGLVISPAHIKDFNHRILILNGRAIQSQAIRKAIDDVYEETCGKRNASYVLYLNLPFKQIDVNIHPSKRNVKIQNETLILMFIKQAVRDVLGDKFVLNKNFLEPKPLFSNASPHVEVVFEETKPYMASKSTVNDASMHKERKPNIGDINDDIVLGNKDLNHLSEKGSETEQENEKGDLIGRGIIELISNQKVIGNVFGLYSLIESGDEVFVVDTHAAHERVLYESFMASYRNGSIHVQPLMFPLLVNLSPSLYFSALSSIQIFQTIGYEIEDGGDNTVLIRALPAVFAQKGADLQFEQLIADLELAAKGLSDYERSEFLIKKACHSAVRGDEDISADELRILLKDLSKCSSPFTCPHGRPIISRLHKKAFMKSFERI